MNLMLYSMLSGAFVIFVAVFTVVAVLAFIAGISKYPKSTVIITLIAAWLILTVLFYLSTGSGGNIG